MSERTTRPFRPVTLDLPDFDPRLRAVADDDPLVEEMVERLRRGVGGMVAVDQWGRPLAWRDVVRTAMGTALAELRDARTARALAAAQTPVPGLQPPAHPLPRLLPEAPAL